MFAWKKIAESQRKADDLLRRNLMFLFGIALFGSSAVFLDSFQLTLSIFSDWLPSQVCAAVFPISNMK